MAAIEIEVRVCDEDRARLGGIGTLVGLGMMLAAQVVEAGE